MPTPTPSKPAIRREKLITAGEEKQWWEFITHLVPDSVFGPFVEGDILQVIFLGVIFGVALNAVGQIGGPVLDAVNRLTADRVQGSGLRHEAGAARCVRGDGLRDRQVRASTLTSLGSPDPTVLRDLGTVRVRRARFGHGPTFGSTSSTCCSYLKEELLLILGTSTAEPALPALMRKLEHGRRQQAHCRARGAYRV